MSGVFDGLRVLDLSWGVAGPMTTMMLADNGAQVTRIEPPDGDPFASQAGYRVWHRGKRSARLDLRAAEGRGAFVSLASKADLVVESFSPGTAARLGVDRRNLATDNPGLITCSITGYGRATEHSDRPGYDGLVAARMGLLYDQRGRTGTPMEYIRGSPGPYPEFDAPEGLVRGAERAGPIFPRTPWPSIGAMYFATLGVVAALRAREVTGEGQEVETSLLQGALAAVCLNWQRVEHPDAPWYWMWPADSRSIEGLYECADERWVHHWTVRPSWVLASAEGDDLKPIPLETAYRDDPDRLSMDGEGFLTGLFLHPQLAEAFKKHPSASWVQAGAEAQMGVAMVRSPAEALADDAFRTDGCVVDIEDPDIGRIRHVGNVLEFGGTPGLVTRPAPRSGEHTAELLDEAAAGGSPGTALRRPSGRSLAHALEGVRVLDLGLGIAGPFAGRALADLGADVIKVHALHDGFWAGTHMGLGTNRGKRSIAVNIKDERGRRVLDRLLEHADVFLTNWRPGAAARLGLDYDTLRDRFPGLIYCNTRGYEKGPRSDLPGTDQTASALTGVEWEDGACDAGNPPLWPRSNMGDTGNAMLAAIAITAALYHREKTGEGQAVSTSIVNAGLLHTSYAWIDEDGRPAEWGHVDGAQYGLSPFYRLYQCADDGWVFLAALRPEDRTKLASAVGAPESVIHDPESCVAHLERCLHERPAKVWAAALDEAGVPVELVDETFCRSLFDDPQTRAACLIAETSAGNVGRFEDPGLLVNLSSTSGVVQRGPCMCGEHSRELLVAHGYSEGEVDALVADGVILDATVQAT